MQDSKHPASTFRQTTSPSQKPNLGRHLQDVQANPPLCVNVGMIDGSDKTNARRLVGVSLSANDAQLEETLLVWSSFSLKVSNLLPTHAPPKQNLGEVAALLRGL